MTVLSLSASIRNSICLARRPSGNSEVVNGPRSFASDVMALPAIRGHAAPQLFDPAGDQHDLVRGARRLNRLYHEQSPIRGAAVAGRSAGIALTVAATEQQHGVSSRQRRLGRN